jgi:hypothetical protein
VVDQKTNNNPVDNFGIRPLPNLEAKFVAANTLIKIEKRDADLFTSDVILKKESEMKDAKHRIFGAKTVKTKRKYKERVIELRDELANMLEDIGAVGNLEAQQLAAWDMFDQNTSSPFFDSEWMFDINNSFDIVIGNPPYGVSVKGQYRKDVVKHLGNVPDYEIYYYFIQVAEELLSDKGILSYIIPNTYLFNNFAKNYRISILEKWNVIEILDCTKFKIFESATVLNTINTWQKNKGGCKTIGYRNTSEANTFKELTNTPKLFMNKEDLLVMNQNWGLAFFLPNEVISIVNKITEQTYKLIMLYDCSQGYIPYRLSDLVETYGKELGTKIKENRLWHSSTQTKEHYIQEIYGRDITKYNYSATGEYVKYGKHVACYVDPVFFTSPRIIVREITNPCIIACYIEDTYINDPQLLPVIAKDNRKDSLYLLWAILNSKLATFYHFNHSPKATKGAFPKILVQDIKDFPLPCISEEQKASITNLVNRILSLKSENADADTSAFENEIDKKVYHLYGLTYDEVLIVDPETPVTREEYEKDYCI